jgi:hypothetical protein
MMQRHFAPVGTFLVVALVLGAQQTPPPIGPRFVALDIFVDSGATPLAAYQFELSASKGEIQIVGVEGGEHPAFAEPPYYDPAALQHERIIIAAFNTGTNTQLPVGKTRVGASALACTGCRDAELSTDAGCGRRS